MPPIGPVGAELVLPLPLAGFLLQVVHTVKEHQRRAGELQAACAQSADELRHTREASELEKASILQHVEVARQRLDDELHKQEARNSEMERCAHETAAMRIEELMTKQADLILERQRLLGALEESRRAVQKSLGVPNPAAAVDSARVAGLEQQLALERKRLVEQAVALQQAERRVAQLESTQQPQDARQQAGQIQRDLTQELQSSNARRIEAELRLHQAEESAKMAGEDLCATKIDMIRLRAALDEHRRLQQSQFFNLSRGNGYRT